MDNLIGIDLIDTNERLSIAGFDQTHLKGAGADGRREISAIGAPFDNRPVDGDLGEKIIDIGIVARRTRQNDRL